MGFFAALMTYLAAAVLLVGGALAGLSVLLAPSETLTVRSAPPLVRAADRKSAEAQKPVISPQAHPRTIPLPATPNVPTGPVVGQTPAVPSPATTGERTKEQAAAQPVRKKKIAKKSAPQLEADTATLGYGPSEPRRRFIFPLDPGW